MTFATSWLIQNYKFRLSVSSVVSKPRENCDCTVMCNRWTPRQTYEPQHYIFRLSVSSVVSITTSQEARPRGNCDSTDVICNRWTPRQTNEPQYYIFRLSVSSLVSITTSKCSPPAPAVGPGQEETVIVPMSEVREISLPDSARCCLAWLCWLCHGNYQATIIKCKYWNKTFHSSFTQTVMHPHPSPTTSLLLFLVFLDFTTKCFSFINFVLDLIHWQAWLVWWLIWSFRNDVEMISFTSNFPCWKHGTILNGNLYFAGDPWLTW